MRREGVGPGGGGGWASVGPPSHLRSASGICSSPARAEMQRSEVGAHRIPQAPCSCRGAWKPEFRGFVGQLPAMSLWPSGQQAQAETVQPGLPPPRAGDPQGSQTVGEGTIGIGKELPSLEGRDPL